MKFCQKCVDAILEATPGVVFTNNPDVLPHTYFEVDNGPTKDIELVSESECEFWSHHALNIALDAVSKAETRLGVIIVNGSLPVKENN